MAPATVLASRALIRLSGPDILGFLQGLVTNDTTLLTQGRPIWAALLTAQGKAQWDFILWPDGDDVLVDCEADQADALGKRLGLYRLRRPIAIDRDDSLSVHWSADGDDDPRIPALGRRWLAPGRPSDASADAAWRLHRLQQAVPEGVAELGSDKTLWLEANAVELHGVSFAKGCYVGQENTARMNWRQKVNRRLFVLAVGEDPGDAARAWYPDHGLAVALLRIDHVQTDRPVRLGPCEARPLLPDWLAQALATDSTA